MGYLGSWKLDDVLTFAVTTKKVSGVQFDADSLPTYRIYEDENVDPIVIGTMAKLDDDNTVGFYSEAVILDSSSSVGFEKGKSYNIRIQATVDGVTGSMPLSFQIEAEVSANVLSAAAVDDIWDEVLTGGTHNVNNSAGKRLRDTSSTVILDGLCPSAPSQSNQIILNGDASAEDGAYDPAEVYIVSGTGEHQTRLILEYDGATKTATLDRNWKIDPDDTSEYRIASHPGREHVNEGLAQDGDTNTITLNALASDEDDVYCGQIIFLRSGIGEDQASKVVTYDGTTKIATVDKNWYVVPDSTTGYVMLPTGSFNTSVLVDTIHDEVIEGTLTSREMQKLFLAVLMGLASGGGTTSIAYRDLLNTKDRVTMTVDSSGNRTVITLDGS